MIIKMEYLHLFETADEHNEYYSSSGYSEPWVAYIEENGSVSYNKQILDANKESWELFNEIFCDNVTEEDRNIFSSVVVTVTSGWTHTEAMNPLHKFTATFKQEGGMYYKLSYTYMYSDMDEGRHTYRCNGTEHLWVPNTGDR